MEVGWSPNHHDKFYSLGTNLNLYKVYNYTNDIAHPKIFDAQDKDMRLSDDTKATLVCTRSGAQCRCIAWHPSLDPDHLVAIGLNNGKVLLSSFGKGTLDSSSNLTGLELNLRHHRSCNYLEWNRHEPFLLAEVTEKQKSDGCIIIWDVRYPHNHSPFEKTSIHHTPSSHTNQFSPLSNYSKPYMEIGVNESCSSFAWFSQEPRLFVCGMNLKNLRIYDIRVPTDQCKPHPSTSTRAINNIAINPSSQHQLASVYENQLILWDRRKFNEPYDTIVQQHNFSNISWCPTKPSLLACSFVNSSTLKLFDMSHTATESNQHFKIEKILKPTCWNSKEDNNISSFAWHPSNSTQLLIATTSGRITHFTAHNRIAMEWSPDLTLACSVNENVVIMKGSGICDGMEEDIAVKMKDRALKQYGIKKHTAENMDCVRGDLRLTKVWQWISSIKPEHQSPTVISASSFDNNLNFLSQSHVRNTSYAQLSTADSSHFHLSLNSSANQNHSLPQSPTLPQLPFPSPQPTTPSSNYSLGNHGFPHSLTTPQTPPNPTFTTPLSGICNIFHKSHDTNFLSLQNSLRSIEWIEGGMDNLLTTPNNNAITLNINLPTLNINPPTLNNNPATLNNNPTTSNNNPTTSNNNPTTSNNNSIIKNKNQIYHSPERTAALEMCGWKRNSDNFTLIQKLEKEGKYVRGAALSVFNIKIFKALQLLEEGGTREKNYCGSNEDLNLVAMALSGFLGSSSSGGDGGGGSWGGVGGGDFWNKRVSLLTPTLKNPYLKALFYFLTTQDPTFDVIVNDTKLELTDRIAFACLHLPINMLLQCLERWTQQLTSDGNPEGIILTGFTHEGVNLLSRYVDKTSDLQSAVLLLLQALPEMVELEVNEWLMMWVEEYRELLDRMGMWVERAEFDVFRMRANKSKLSTRQIHISCTFCNKAIVMDTKNTRSRTTATSAVANVKPRTQSCPHCRKPLPRCSVCMLFMGTASGIGCPKIYKATVKKKECRISEWFTWCQRCLHGGHAGHMMDWFKCRSVCPVSGCECMCEQLDKFSKQEVGCDEEEKKNEGVNVGEVQQKNVDSIYHRPVSIDNSNNTNNNSNNNNNHNLTRASMN